MPAVPRRARPAPPVSLRRVWFSHTLNSPDGRLLRRLLEFLHRHKLLTRAGRRLHQMLSREERLTLRPEHVKSHAHGFLEQYDLRHTEAEQEWELYRERYDFCKPGRPTPYQRLLLEYSRDRTLNGLLAWVNRFPELDRELASVAESAGRDEARIRLFLEAWQQGTGSENWASHPELSLSLLGYLRPRLAGPGCLAEAAALSRRLELEENNLKALARACNLGPEDRQAVLSLDCQSAQWLARCMDDLFGHAEGRHPAACALRTVGDAVSLELLQGTPMKEEQVRYGPRPGRPVTQAVMEEAAAAIQERQDACGTQ